MVTSSDSAGLILQAAIDCVAVDGAAGLRVDAVANRAGFNKRMIYHYFSDRAGLLAGVYQSQVAVLLHSNSPLSEPSQRVLQALLKLTTLASLDDSHLPTKASAPQAARIVLPWLIQMLGHIEAEEPIQLGQFATELMALALPIAQASNHPLETEARFNRSVGVSERSHSDKPVFRVASKSRRRTIAGEG